MKKLFFIFTLALFAVCLQGYGQDAKQRGEERADEIVKFLKIYDQNQIRMIKIASEEYYKKYDEIEESEPDPEKRKIKHLRNEQKFESRLKSITTPEQYRNYEIGLKNKKKPKSK
jgi:hypothetical protein